MQPKLIVIAGAGIAGLTCADLLLKKGYQTIILEATNRYGGRIKPLKDFLPGIFEAGGQEIHFKYSSYFEMAEKAGAILQSDEDNEWYIWDPYQNKMISYQIFESLYPQVSCFHQHIIDKVSEPNDMSVYQRLQTDGFDMNFKHLYDCFFATETGGSIDNLSSIGLGVIEGSYNQIDENFNLINMHHKDILDQNFQEVYKNIQFDSVVKKVEVCQNKVNIIYQKFSKTEQIQADYFVSAVPITQVKKIQWSPPFDPIRQNQIDLVTMDRGGKLFFQLDQPLQLENCSYIVIKTKPSLQIWNNSSKDYHVLIAIITEEGFMEIQEFGIQHYVDEIIKDLRDQLKVDYKLIKYHFEDWGSHPYIEGLYSYPKPGADINYREIIGKPILNRIYFCGEAYHPFQPQTIHGANQTACNTAKNLIEFDQSLKM